MKTSFTVCVGIGVAILILGAALEVGLASINKAWSIFWKIQKILTIFRKFRKKIRKKITLQINELSEDVSVNN
jgi:hypothetical protein